ncbi:MAG: GTP cyclohydrolase IIa [Natronomonas sp.]
MSEQSTQIQVSLAQLDDYGPWTTTPEPRRETDLQALQSRLYADFADFVGTREGYVFPGRWDNMLAVTNGIDPAEHRRYQRLVRNRYPVTVSVGVGRGETPVAAVEQASERLQTAGSAQDATRSEVLSHGEVVDSGAEALTVAHFDIADATGKYTDRVDAGAAELLVRETAIELNRYVRESYGGLSSFVGGDNVIAVCPPTDPERFESAIEHVAESVGVELRVGVGYGSTAARAGIDAKHALEAGREADRPVTGRQSVADD